jgi:hypothetical protein
VTFRAPVRPEASNVSLDRLVWCGPTCVLPFLPFRHRPHPRCARFFVLLTALRTHSLCTCECTAAQPYIVPLLCEHTLSSPLLAHLSHQDHSFLNRRADPAPRSGVPPAVPTRTPDTDVSKESSQ